MSFTSCGTRFVSNKFYNVLKISEIINMSLALSRLQKEYKDILKEEDEGQNISARPIDDSLMIWRGKICGPIDSPYYGGYYYLEIKFTEDYPFCPPKVTFLTRIYHPNISPSGLVCVDILTKEFVTKQSLYAIKQEDKNKCNCRNLIHICNPPKEKCMKLSNSCSISIKWVLVVYP